MEVKLLMGPKLGNVIFPINMVSISIKLKNNTVNILILTIRKTPLFVLKHYFLQHINMKLNFNFIN